MRPIQGFRPFGNTLVIIGMTMAFSSAWMVTTPRVNALADDNGDSAVSVRSSIGEVVLYRDRAAVERSADIELAGGYAELIFPSLPDGIMDDTVRVKSSRDENITILGIEVEKKYLVKSRQKRIRELEAKIEELRNDDNDLVDRMNAAKTAIRFIESIGDFASLKAREGLLYKGINLNEMSETMGFVERNILKEQSKIRQIVVKRKDISDRIRVLEKKLTDIAGSRYMGFRGNFFAAQTTMLNQSQTQQLNQYTGDAAEMDRETSLKRAEDREKWARVTLRVKRPGKYRLHLSYVIRGAGWQPLYDVRTDLQERKIDLTYYAEVKQSTGEDWNDVKLYLSTADPRKAANPPALNPWMITKYVPPVPAQSRRSAMGGVLSYSRSEMPAAVADEMSTGYAQPSEPETDRREIVREKGISVTYAVAARKTIPSDNEVHKTPIDTLPFTAKDAEFLYVVIPERGDQAFLRTKIVNASKFTLFPGKANLYLDGDYVGNTGIGKTVTPDKKFTLHFGVDEGLRATKTLVKKYTEEKGLFGGDTRINYHYRIKLENNKKKEASFLVMDRVPVSQDEAITVGMDVLDPAPLSDEKEKKGTRYKQGIRRWRLSVPAMSSRTIEIKFHVQHGKDVRVSGGL